MSVRTDVGLNERVYTVLNRFKLANSKKKIYGRENPKTSPQLQL
jgi:hypothetical protein